jgi:hypothetical protein
MDTAVLSALSALAGSVFGGLTSGLTTWMSLRSQARAGHRLHRVAQREELYRDFVAAASTTYGRALLNSEPAIDDFIALYSMVSRMRILSSPPVIASADVTMKIIIDAFFAPNKTIAELHALIKSGKAVDPLKHFSEITRDELNAIG